MPSSVIVFLPLLATKREKRRAELDMTNLMEPLNPITDFFFHLEIRNPNQPRQAQVQGDRH